MFEIRRYGAIVGGGYGERIYSGASLRDCLKYLQDMVASNSYTVERHGFTLVATASPYGKVNRMYRIVRPDETALQNYCDNQLKGA